MLTCIRHTILTKIHHQDQFPHFAWTAHSYTEDLLGAEQDWQPSLIRRQMILTSDIDLQPDLILSSTI